MNKKLFGVFADDELVPVGVKQSKPLFYIIQPNAALAFFRIALVPDMNAVMHIKIERINIGLQGYFYVRWV